jgi:hypothetical protein
VDTSRIISLSKSPRSIHEKCSVYVRPQSRLVSTTAKPKAEEANPVALSLWLGKITILSSIFHDELELPQTNRNLRKNKKLLFFFSPPQIDS